MTDYNYAYFILLGKEVSMFAYFIHNDLFHLPISFKRWTLLFYGKGYHNTFQKKANLKIFLSFYYCISKFVTSAWNQVEASKKLLLPWAFVSRIIDKIKNRFNSCTASVYVSVTSFKFILPSTLRIFQFIIEIFLSTATKQLRYISLSVSKCDKRGRSQF